MILIVFLVKLLASEQEMRYNIFTIIGRNMSENGSMLSAGERQRIGPFLRRNGVRIEKKYHESCAWRHDFHFNRDGNCFLGHGK